MLRCAPCAAWSPPAQSRDAAKMQREPHPLRRKPPVRDESRRDRTGQSAKEEDRIIRTADQVPPGPQAERRPGTGT
jgi:hypothetical protein